MLKATIEAEENYDSFLRPAIYDSLIAVLDFYKLRSATNIYFNGADDVVKLIGNSMTDGPTADRYSDGTFRNKIFITAEVERSEFWNHHRAMVERPVFINTKLPLILCPLFENKLIEVKVVSMHNTEADAKKMRVRINRQREAQVVDFNFSPINHMVVNKGLLDFFKIVNQMLKDNEPTTPDFEEWFREYARFNFTGITNPAGNLPQIVVSLKANNIGIFFTEPFIAKVAKGNTYGRFEVEFSYKFYFNEFVGWELDYPLNIYQTQIPEGYIPAVQPQHKARASVPTGPEGTSMREEFPPTDFIQSPYYLILPEHDPWRPPYTWWVQPVIQGQLALADEEQQQLGSIFDLEGFQWRPKAVEYIKRRKEWAFIHHETPFLFQVFEGDQAVRPEFLRMDEDGVVTLLKRPDLTKTYHMVVNIDYAIRDYTKALWDDVGWDENLWAIIRTIFNWMDFNKFPKPWIHNLPTILYNIDLGYGNVRPQFNIYQMQLGILAHNKKG